ncbi:transposase [Methylobacter sp. S3L5C]|uniref:transposase n=1 Tax=Methylobacter sp. S3L5C TaxID=2839024 RepID=UPI001FAC3360|nr:transposase [Methylobacter sp. S3L5C]UOA07008.1 transposase [Methylobacter sp. S3L5C]
MFDGNIADQFDMLGEIRACELGRTQDRRAFVDVSRSKSSLGLFAFGECALVLKRHGITEGVLVLDESDRARSKRTKRIYGVHKQKHKVSGGYVNGQTVVLLLLVTQMVTLPVGFAFYRPDPALTAWSKEDKRLKKAGMAKKDRPVQPVRDSRCPTKTQLALRLLQAFKDAHGDIKIKAVLADALYGEAGFMDTASRIFDINQVISQLRENQIIEYKSKKSNLKAYFNTINKGIEVTLQVRGGEQVKATVSSARLKVLAQGKKRLVVAVKYEGESDYRYLVATDMTWRTMDIIQAYTLRWLVGSGGREGYYLNYCPHLKKSFVVSRESLPKNSGPLKKTKISLLLSGNLPNTFYPYL